MSVMAEKCAEQKLQKKIKIISLTLDVPLPSVVKQLRVRRE